jgi:hypothetical protein
LIAAARFVASTVSVPDCKKLCPVLSDAEAVKVTPARTMVSPAGTETSVAVALAFAGAVGADSEPVVQVAVTER